jgi:elongation factor 3
VLFGCRDAYRSHAFHAFLKGETVPQEGTVYKHPSLRVGYVSQHATHHIGNHLPLQTRIRVNFPLEHHLEKTPIGYIQWRFQDGHDRKSSVTIAIGR